MLPEDYLIFIDNCKKYDTYLKSDRYLYLCPPETLEYENKVDLLDDFFAIGNNGGGVGVFINKKDRKIYVIPYTGMEKEDAIVIALSFEEFITRFENDQLDIY